MTLELLASRWGKAFRAGKGDFLFAEAQRRGSEITLMIPTSYMNRSGGPIVNWINYFRIDPEEVLIIYDDHDLPLGRIRLRERGSSGGHRGMEDIIRLAGTEDIPRVRIGIRTNVERDELSHQVLSKIPKSQFDYLTRIFEAAADAVEMTLTDGIVAAMNHYNNLEIE